MLTTFATYRSISRDIDRSLAQTKAEKPVALETEYYLKNIAKVRSIDDLLNDTRLFKYTMRAFGLADMDHAKAFMRKVLAEGIDSADSFARRLDDDRFLQFASVFNFARDGDQTTAKAAARQGTVDRYVRQSLEAAAGAEDEGVRLALYFLREAPRVTSVYGLLADPALSKVVKTLFDFPDEMSAADIDKQAAAITRRLDLASLKDPAALDRMITRFTAVWDTTSNATPDPRLALFDTSAEPRTVDLDLIVTLNALKHGGS
jgi:hypothetical protein